MQRIRILGAFLLMQGFVASTAGAHSGALDANGCHCEPTEVKPDKNATVTVKKSRENVCHDRPSPNYSTLKYFIACETMPECPASGGRAPG